MTRVNPVANVRNYFKIKWVLSSQCALKSIGQTELIAVLIVDKTYLNFFLIRFGKNVVGSDANGSSGQYIPAVVFFGLNARIAYKRSE